MDVGGGKTRKVSKYGSRRKVWNGTAEMTVGKLRKEDLMKTKRGRIVSKKRYIRMTGGKENESDSDEENGEEKK
jgi:DVNP family